MRLILNLPSVLEFSFGVRKIFQKISRVTIEITTRKAFDFAEPFGGQAH